MQIIEKLQNRLAEPLPGLEAQMKMAPMIRKWDYEIPENVKYSAVLVLLYPHQGELHLAFMKRPDSGAPHSGQVCFPGGRREESDADYTETALREAWEEMGIIPEKVQVLGKLSDLYIPPSNYMVYPSVGYTSERPDFVPQPNEVAAMIEVPLSYLLQEEIQIEKKVPMTGQNTVFMETPGYEVFEYFIWGATAMMISEFLHIIKEVKSE
jgi:8-oxo-dGTP pyrophosphatase MutT (NUDIX family)